MSLLGSHDLVRLLAEPRRRRVVAALILAPSSTADEVTTATGLSLREVTEAVGRLEAAGLIEAGPDGSLLLLEEAFALAARTEAPPPAPSAHTDQPPEVARVLDQSFKDGRLVHLPSKRSRRLIVLDRLAQEFEPGEHYTERQVNATLSAFDPDVATLRRYLVDEGFLDRVKGEYWRSGGSVPL